MSRSDKSKLDGISTGANKTETSLTNGNIKIDGIEKSVYSHPSNHPPSIISQDANNRFVSDAEKSVWNAKTAKYAATVGTGSATQFTITHGLGTVDVAVTLRENTSPYEVVYPDIQIIDENNIKLLFGSAPTNNQYRVTVVG
jgi:hypothetical protein